MSKETQLQNTKDIFAEGGTEFLTLGEGQIGYVRELNDEAMAELPAEVELERAWGVFSATGEALALCDSPDSAWMFFADHELQPVSVH